MLAKVRPLVRRALQGSTRRTAALILAGLLAGCGGHQDPPSKRGASFPAHSVEVPAASDAEPILELPTCDGAFVPEAKFLPAGWRRRSRRIGPLRIMEATGLAKPGLAGRHAWKIRTLIPPLRTLTIEIGAADRARLGFLKQPTSKWSGSQSDLSPVLRIRNCPVLPPEIGELPAGQHYGFPMYVGVRRDSCVLLTVTRDGGRSHRRVISFGGGDCDGKRA
jgi:hypothetical protein